MEKPQPLPKMADNIQRGSWEHFLWNCQNQSLLREHYKYNKAVKHREYLDSMKKYESRNGARQWREKLDIDNSTTTHLTAITFDTSTSH